jgi:hypothetical protein
MNAPPEGSSRWAGHRPVLPRHLFGIVVAVVLSAALQMVGTWQMQPFHHSKLSGDRPLFIYYAGFGLALIAMFAVIVLLLRQQVLEISDDEIALGRWRCARRSVTLLVRPWRRLAGEGTLLEIRSGADLWRVGATTRRTPSGHRGASAIASWKLDALMSTLDFNEILSQLGLPEAPPRVVGLRVNLVPFRRTAFGALRSMKPFFTAALILAVLGPTLGPIVSRLRFGNAIMTPVVLFVALSGIVGVMVSFHRPAKLIRLVIGAEQATAMDLRSGATLATAPLPDLGVERFQFLLMGGRSEGISFRNRGLEIAFPRGFTISIALPAFGAWPGHVKRRRAPRWTVDLAAAAQLVPALRVE